MMSQRLTRRRFLQTSAAAGAALALGGRVLAADEKKAPPSERLNVGVIGVHNQGEYNWGQLKATGEVNIGALCDVDERYSGKARETFPKATFYTDYRKLLDNEKGLDAVLVATPDHTHAIITLTALKANLHVYCEKPLTHTVTEAREVAQTAAKYKRVTQMGTQIHAGSNYRRVVEIIESRTIGPIKEVHVWCGAFRSGGDRPADTPPIPEGVHWDLWLGPAPQRPYHSAYMPFDWRGWWDFGGGTLADMACHHMDLSFWALKLRHPTKVSAEGPPPHLESAPKHLVVAYEFPPRGDLPAVTLKWYDGGKRPSHFDDPKFPKWGDGTLFIGEKGMLLAGYNDRKLLPEKEFADFKEPKPTIADSIGHHKEWIQACKNGTATTCNFDYSGALTEAALLGDVAYRSGKPLIWDAMNLKVNESEAEKFLRTEYRKSW
jgi:predicted dehydrogenase